MSRMFVWTAFLFISTTLYGLCLAKSDYWPNYSCHPANDTATHSNAVKFNRMAWYSCREPYEKWNGRCDKVCLLLNRDILVRIKKDDGKFENIFGTNALISELRREMGYKERDAMPKYAEDIIAKVRLEATECPKKYPEFAQLDLKGHSCDPWKNLLQCVEMAIVSTSIQQGNRIEGVKGVNSPRMVSCY